MFLHSLVRQPGCGAVGSASDSRARGLWFDSQSGHILTLLFPLIQKRAVVSIAGESMCT